MNAVAQLGTTEVVQYAQQITDVVNSSIQLLSSSPSLTLVVMAVVGYLALVVGWSLVKPILFALFWPLRLIRVVL